MTLSPPIDRQVLTLVRPVEVGATTFQTYGRFVKTSSTNYLVGKQVVTFSIGQDISLQESAVINVVNADDITTIDAANDIYEYTIVDRGLDTDQTSSDSINKQSSNEKRHPGTRRVGIAVSATYMEELRTVFEQSTTSITGTLFGNTSALIPMEYDTATAKYMPFKGNSSGKELVISSTSGVADEAITLYTLNNSRINVASLSFSSANGKLVYADYDTSTGSITAFADAGSGSTNATSSAHGLAVNDIVTIKNTTNYNGDYIVTAVPDANTFTFVKAFTSTETGDWDKFTALLRLEDDASITSNAIKVGVMNGDEILMGEVSTAMIKATSAEITAEAGTGFPNVDQSVTLIKSVAPGGAYVSANANEALSSLDDVWLSGTGVWKYETPSYDIGSLQTLKTLTSSFVDGCKIGDDKFLSVYASTSIIYLKAFTVTTDGTYSFGTEVSFSASALDSMKVERLDDDRAVIIYQNSSNQIMARVVTVSVLTCTVAAETTFSSVSPVNGAANVATCSMGTDKFAVVFKENTSLDIKCFKADVSGTTITQGGVSSALTQAGASSNTCIAHKSDDEVYVASGENLHVVDLSAGTPTSSASEDVNQLIQNLVTFSDDRVGVNYSNNMYQWKYNGTSWEGGFNLGSFNSTSQYQSRLVAPSENVSMVIGAREVSSYTVYGVDTTISYTASSPSGVCYMACVAATEKHILFFFRDTSSNPVVTLMTHQGYSEKQFLSSADYAKDATATIVGEGGVISGLTDVLVGHKYREKTSDYLGISSTEVLVIS